MAYVLPFPLFLYYSLTNTSQTARTLISEGKEKGLVVAYTQKDGRGHFDRPWISPEGNFYGTFFLKRHPTNHTLPLYVIAHMIKKITPYVENGLSFRWPNDLFFYDKKVASIFCEREGDFALITININLKTFPENIDQPTSCLFDDPNIQIELPQFSDVIKENFHESLDLPFSEIHSFCSKRLYGIDLPRTVRTKDSEIQGIVKGVDHNGALLLKNPDGILIHISQDELLA